jgi:heme/copper-type cytochrome/quinol oxidase subunit 2
MNDALHTAANLVRLAEFIDPETAETKRQPARITWLRMVLSLSFVIGVLVLMTMSAIADRRQKTAAEPKAEASEHYDPWAKD